MNRNLDLAITALAPAIWGSTYLITTEFLPDGYPLTVSMLRALPAGLLLLLLVRKLPAGKWWGRVFLLGALNFSIFWSLLFLAAYRLPGGVAATVGATQPLMVIFIARMALGAPILPLSVGAALVGLGGVALLILSPGAEWDMVGIMAGLGGAVSMAFGTVLSRKWQPPVSLLTFTAWQLTAGGLLLVPAALWFEPPLPALTGNNIFGFTYLGLIGAAFTYLLWFRGIAKLPSSLVASLGFLSPLMAVLLGWFVLGQHLNAQELTGVALVFGSVWLSQNAHRIKKPEVAKAPSN
ncbi:EamA family transporter [Kordiimonas sp.]|uniref:EamA family transporter n=1 Tax=Kordiimonas sp. TaxID=1970157 RepID=UPI003A8D03C9